MLGGNARDAEAGCFWGVGRAEMTRGTKTVAWALARASYAPQYWKSTASFNRRKFCCHPQPTFVPRVRNAQGTFLAVARGGDAGLLVCPRHGFSEVYWEFARAEAEATGGFLASIQYLGFFWVGPGRNSRGTFLAVARGGDAGLLVCPRHGFSEVWWEFARAEAEATGGFLASIQYLGCFWGRAGQECPGYVFGRGVGGDAGLLVCPRREFSGL